MDKKGKARRNLIAAIPASLVGVAVSSPVLAEGVLSQAAGVKPEGQPHLQDLSKPTSVMLRIESLDPDAPPEMAQAVLPRVSLGSVVSLRQQTKIASPYFFSIDVDRGNSTPSDLNLTITLYDGAGTDLGSINIGDGGTAIFKPQQLMFYVSSSYS